MDSAEGVRFCEKCPKRNLCVGPVSETRQHNVDASFFSARGGSAGTNVSLGTHFYDENGNKAEHFPPHTTLEDVRNCTKLEVDYRTGPFRLKALKDCGAYVVAVHRFRQRVFGSPFPPNK